MSILETLKNKTKTKNDGRGVSCINTVIFYLERGDKNTALAVCINENDKISSYPDLRLLLFDLIPEYENRLNKIADIFGFERIRK